MSSWQRDDALFMERGSSIGESMASAVGSFVMASPIGLSDVAVSPMDPTGRRAMVAGDKADSFSRTREASAQPELEMTVEEVVSPTSSSSSNGSHGGLYGHMMDQSHSSDRSHHRSNASCERARGFSDENELQFGDIDDDDIDSVAGTNDDAVLRNGRLGLVLNVDGDSTQPTLSSSVGTSHGLSSMTRKTSSSFSDLGDFDEVTIPDTTPNGTPITPTFRSFYDGNGSLGRSIYSGMSSGHHVSPAPRGSLVAGGGKAFGRTTPSPRHGVPADEHQPLFGTINPIAGEVVRMEVENAAYIIFYKTEENDNDYESGDTEGAQGFTDRQEYTRAGSCDDEASDDLASYKPPKTLKSLGDAGHKVRTTNCFTRDYAHPTRSLGRGLFRASTSVGSAFLKGAAGLVNRTYEGGANGGVFGFAKGLGMGMLGLGAHTVKGAFRGVGHVTNVVGEMVMGSAPHFSIDGSLVLTNYRLVWMAQSTPDTLEIPLSTILAIENSASATHVINIECKSLLRFSVAFRDESTSYELLSSVWDLFSSSSYVFAHTHYQALLQNGEKAADDLYTPLFQFYNAEEDYSRLKLFEDGTMKLLDNSQYILYPSYPAEIVVPAELTDEDLQELSSYRSARRIPAVVWRHPHSGAMMTRCAQPCAGLSGYVADADKKFVAAMQRATGGYDSIFHFYDARSQIAAAANSAQGKGTEDTRNYDYTELHHCDIANIHAVRSSFVSLSAVCQPGEDLSSGDWYTQLQNTFWFMHISRILASAHNISETMCRGESVMVHCSDGWDRTPQLTGLVQLLLDPYYRTLSGFLKLIEKEWVSFGHMFRTRYSQGDCPGHQEVEEQSPVFVQWIDAVWQVWRQEPWAFEFNEGLLGALYDNVFSGLYGTFLYNNERERRERELKHPTRSFWSHVIEKRDQYVNIDYDPTNNFKSVGESLRFSFDENALVLWEKHLDHADPVTRKYS